jgi:hypothetical protein
MTLRLYLEILPLAVQLDTRETVTAGNNHEQLSVLIIILNLYPKLLVMLQRWELDYFPC